MAILPQLNISQKFIGVSFFGCVVNVMPVIAAEFSFLKFDYFDHFFFIFNRFIDLN